MKITGFVVTSPMARFNGPKYSGTVLVKYVAKPARHTGLNTYKWRQS